MTIIDTIKQPGFTQWIDGFVVDILEAAKIHANEAVITDLYNKRIYLMVDGQEYMIRTRNFFPAGRDENGITCSENVEYTLYAGHEHCEEISDPISLTVTASGILNIHWINDPKIYQDEIDQYVALHGMPEELDEPQEGEYFPLHIKDLLGGSWDMHMDVRILSAPELLAVITALVNGELEEAFRTPKLVAFIRGVYQHCVSCIVNDFCFENNTFDPNYALNLIAACPAHKLCCLDCAEETWGIVDRLYRQHMAGDYTALDIIKATLGEFFIKTRPFYVDVQ